jgi:hypothetical protein
MTEYEEKSTKKHIEMLGRIISESKEKRKILEDNLIEEARKPYGKKTTPFYADALMNSIQVETSVIDYMENEVSALNKRLNA